MDLPAFRRLVSPEGQIVLAAAADLQPTEATYLACHQRLRKQFPDDLVKAALETALLRRKASGKFDRADHMYFTRDALEQSSGEAVSTYRAERFAGYERVCDWCCGIGGDLIGLSAVTNVVAVDIDPLRVVMAEENLRAYDRRGRAEFVVGDVLDVSLPEIGAAFVDPDRRRGGTRQVRVREYSPPLDAVRARFRTGFPLGVKVAPGVPWHDLRTFDAEAEFISVGGELKECDLWFGPVKSTGRRATILPVGATLAADHPAEPAEPGVPRAYLYDPDPAIVRSGLVANLGHQLAARPIDPDIAYLTSDRCVPTPFARCYRIVETMPFHARQLGDRLRSMKVGPVTMTKRGSAVDVDELRRKWKLTGPNAATVVLTRVLGRPYALIVAETNHETRRRTENPTA
ncbi:MAG TPA: class I SAM-dependent methyltransferase [Gemmataceae bacterium]|nr:class I SAM-dependent methyltransferase [Gemmataceae bacterium]